MKDIRISIRISEEEHYRLKLLAIKKKKSIQSIMYDCICKEIAKEEKDTNEKN